MTRQEIIETINRFHETKQDAEDWWNKNNPAFNLVPKDMLRTKYGLQRLEQMINHIEKGNQFEFKIRTTKRPSQNTKTS